MTWDVTQFGRQVLPYRRNLLTDCSGQVLCFPILNTQAANFNSSIPCISFISVQLLFGAWDSVVVKALRYCSDGPGIDSRWCHWGFFRISPDRTMCPEVDSASENEYQVFLLG